MIKLLIAKIIFLCIYLIMMEIIFKKSHPQFIILDVRVKIFSYFLNTTMEKFVSSNMMEI